MSNEHLVNELIEVTLSQNHQKTTEFLVQSKDQLLELNLLGDLFENFLQSSLYKFFANINSWQSLIKEAEKHYALMNLVAENLSSPSLNMYHAFVKGFNICFSNHLPDDFKRLMVMCPDECLLNALARWIIQSKSDLHQLKRNGTLKSTDFKKIATRISQFNASTYADHVELPKFGGPLSGWLLSDPEYIENTQFVSTMWCYQGMGWFSLLTHQVGSKNEKNIFVRMGGGSNGWDSQRNDEYFSSTQSDDFPMMTWDEFQVIAHEIVEDIPAFNHAMVVTAP